MSSVEIKVMDFPEVKRFCDQTEKAIAELTARAEKAEHERDAQHALVLKLTAERDEAQARADTAEAEEEALRVLVEEYKEASGLLVGGDPDGVTPKILSDFIQKEERRATATESRLSSLRAKVEGLPWARRGSGADITGAVEKNDVLALLDKESP